MGSSVYIATAVRKFRSSVSCARARIRGAADEDGQATAVSLRSS